MSLLTELGNPFVRQLQRWRTYGAGTCEEALGSESSFRLKLVDLWFQSHSFATVPGGLEVASSVRSEIFVETDTNPQLPSPVGRH
jgi:hypothetical protein